jgi:hypothetical protein
VERCIAYRKSVLSSGGAGLFSKKQMEIQRQTAGVDIVEVTSYRSSL